MSRDVGRRRIYRSRAVRRRRSALAVAVAAALALIVLVGAQGAKPKPVRVTFDRRAAAGYADTWALGDNPEYWSSPDRDCANFVSQCLAAGDIVYLGNVVDGKLEWQHVIICAGRQEGEWVYDSHTAARRHGTLAHWYPAHFSAVRFCRIADSVVYTQQ